MPGRDVVELREQHPPTASSAPQGPPRDDAYGRRHSAWPRAPACASRRLAGLAGCRSSCDAAATPTGALGTPAASRKNLTGLTPTRGEPSRNGPGAGPSPVTAGRPSPPPKPARGSSSHRRSGLPASQSGADRRAGASTQRVKIRCRRSPPEGGVAACYSCSTAASVFSGRPRARPAGGYAGAGEGAARRDAVLHAEFLWETAAVASSHAGLTTGCDRAAGRPTCRPANWRPIAVAGSLIRSSAG